MAKMRGGLFQSISGVALVVGFLIALYSWQCQNMASSSARREAEVDARVNYGAAGYVALGGSEWEFHGRGDSHEGGARTFTTYPLAERAFGMAFGFGVCFLGAFGLSALRRRPGDPIG